ncbi:metallophosphoesterase [Phycisphaerales bacterium AB-hyl4]|uniref:Metallophosphoesterase n=1 Tax=Natronomicrosphaera hydrolytica TaxID=3242702 RepID=A0ABV4U1U9_9BACT
MPLTPRLIQPVDLSLPHLPDRLVGLRIAHLTDLHIRRHTRLHTRIARQLADTPCDLLILTGDYMENTGHEAATIDTLAKLLNPLHPRLGTFGVFGNHDNAPFRDHALNLPVHWLINDTALPTPDLELWGLDTRTKSDHEGADAIAMLRHRQSHPTNTHTNADSNANPNNRPLKILLAHSPAHLTVAADLGIDLMLSGHTHGGQCRLPTGHALVNACDMPLHLIAGVLRHRNTLATVSRGVGHSGRIPRAFCPPHIPLYTLHQQPLPGQFTLGIKNVHPW